jgi:signal transduction histidine kinase
VLLVTVALTSVASGLVIARKFGGYVANQEQLRSDNIVRDLGAQYDPEARGWSDGYLHTVGMYALYDGYILKVSDASGNVVWDAENHDMSLCGQIMSEISGRMDRVKNDGGFVTRAYDINVDGAVVGAVSVNYYGPYFFSENDFMFMKALNTVLLSVGAAACALSVVVGGLSARRIARPIAKTAYIARQISRGNYDIRFESETKTSELRELSAAVNLLSEALGEQERLRKRLTADVSHELRTPLTAVALQLEAMLDGVWDTAPERLMSCYEDVQRLGKLVSDLGRLEAIEGDGPQLDRSRTDLLELVSSAAKSMKPEADGKRLSLEIAGERCTAEIDGDRIRQVVTNLLSNAISYTPAGGHIRLFTASSGGEAVIEVEDDGIGIAEDELPLIFERFYRADRSRARRTGGAGIGLTIVKSIVSAHGGVVTADSRADHGSRFTVRIPMENALEREPEAIKKMNLPRSVKA